MLVRVKKFARETEGTVMVLTGLGIVAFLMFAAIAIDIGHLMVVKNELQNAADAGANAGALHLKPYITTNPPLPNWSAAQTAANTATKANKTDDFLITDCQVQTGYFNLISRDLQSTGITPTSVDVPAVRVTVSRADGQNTGPVLTFLARVAGINFMNVSADATGMISCPGSAPPGSLFPIALNYHFVSTNFDRLKHISFDIQSTYHSEEEEAGQWTSFDLETDDATNLRNLMYGGNPRPIRIGNLDPIYIVTGTTASIYDNVSKDFIGKTVFLPVVDYNIYTHTYNETKCFVPVLIEAVNKGKKYITVRFDYNKTFQTNDAGGECYGAYMSPRMVN